MLISITSASVVSAARLPVAAFAANPAFGVVGSVVKLDGRLSTDPDQQPLTYAWRFVSVPIGSQVESEGFRTLDTDTTTLSPSQVSFSPDVVGEYVIGLVVTNSVFSSAEQTSVVSIRAILIPHGRGIIPDGKFIWSYIRDVWSQVEGKEFFETLWSALIQITGTELLKLYQADFNKSIRDIQDRYQRRWLSYEPKLALAEADLTFYIGDHFAGRDASTVNLALEGEAVIIAADEVVVILGARAQNVAGELFTVVYSEDPGNVGVYDLQSLNTERNGYKLNLPELDPAPDTIGTGVEWDFTLGDTHWSLAGSAGHEYAVSLSERPQLIDALLPLFNKSAGVSTLIRTGDVIRFHNGPNTGYYRIIEKSGSFVTVDHAPPSFSDATTSLTAKTTVYRPVGFKLTQPAIANTDTFVIPFNSVADASVLAPGRIVIVNGQSYTIVRSVVDPNELIPSIVITVSSVDLSAGIRSLNWRTPHTLISQTMNFEEQGVTTGDILGFDIILADSELTSTIEVEVVGVKENTLGFVLTNAEVVAGEIPPIPNEYFLKLTDDFGITGLTENQDGTLTFSGQALDYLNSLSSGIFKRKYWNQELTPTTEVQVNPVFLIKPKYIIRNSRIPVDPELRSVPLLQEWIVQPAITERNGKIYQVSNEKEFELRHKPVVLNENLDFLIDDEVAFAGMMTINTGSVEVQADDADFLDRSIGPGDVFTIEAPLTLIGDYTIERVLSNSKVRLTRPIPAYVLGTFVNARVALKRKKTGEFLRFVPGLFTSLNPAPDRLWAEVSFFDNDPTVEDNFGILVGLTKQTLENASRNINYRQAVSGLMFAFTRGSAIDKVRLGAQILLGLPFAEHRGIIRSIEGDYRLDVEGNPILGRLLVEDIDATGAVLGTLRIYTYPIDAPSALAGLETNPATGLIYKIGDTVELFAVLTKGVEIIDYLTNPLDSNFSAIAQLQQFHSVRLRANDNIFNLNELELVSDFLRKITPHYIAYSLITASEFADVVLIQDQVISLLKNDSNLIDNASLGIPATLMLNSTNANGVPQILHEDGVFSIRRTGTDLITNSTVIIPGAATVESPAGGFINHKTNERFEAPLVRSDMSDYLVILSGNGAGTYQVTAVNSDTQIEISGAPTYGFEDLTGIPFLIVRKVSSGVFSGNAVLVNGNATATLITSDVAQLRTKGVVPGDWLIVQTPGGSSYRFLIKVVKESTLGSGIWNKVELSPVPTFSGSQVASIVRPSLLSSSEGGGFTIVSTGVPQVTVTVGFNVTAMINVGDELILDDPASSRVTVLDPYVMYVTPTLPAGTYNATLAPKKRPGTVVGWDHIEKFDPTDEVEVSLVESEKLATTTATSKLVSFQFQRTTAPTSGPTTMNPRTSGVLPGDFLVLTSGADATVDVGFGPGLYPIVLVSTTNVTLSVALTANDVCSWKILRRR